MSIWKVRHEGSPEFMEGLSSEQVMEGVLEGQWEPTDEVLGPDDVEWQSLETHPHFAEAVADAEPPAPLPPPDETRLDMNPLIDVALVLLIFYMVSTTYEELRKKMQAPDSHQDQAQTKAPAIQDNDDFKRMTIRVVVTMQEGKPVIKVQNEEVDEKGLQEKITTWRDRTHADKLAVEMDKKAPWKTFIAIQDAAAGARISETIRLEREEPEP